MQYAGMQALPTNVYSYDKNLNGSFGVLPVPKLDSFIQTAGEKVMVLVRRPVQMCDPVAVS